MTDETTHIARQAAALEHRPRTMTDRLIRAVGPILEWKYGHRKGGDIDAIFEELLNAYEPVVEASNRTELMRQAIDASAGFATSGAEARWIADMDAGVYDEDAPERIWLQEPVGLEDERTWCVEPQTDDDTPYVRADLARPSLAGDERVALAIQACTIIDAAVRAGHESVSALLLHLMEAAVPARAALSAMNTPAQGGEE